ncbi:phosphatase PAP2 family protein [Mastigocladopsis repens]|uniref:phosphatase PAP2 family protein n=1 Tax=Mastigocladopsis repens TaxID=221287 RepID=UPI00036039C2|nr:phosphatase PAP2 family protein [Mastigocladopsis repens]
MGTHDFSKIPYNNPLVRTIHTAVKGRARYKVNGLYCSQALKRYLELRLSEKEGIGQVHANPYTGNVLIFFDLDFSLNAIALLIQGIVLDYSKQAKKSPLTGEMPLAKTTEALTMQDVPLDDQVNMVDTGTRVTDGQGVAVVAVTEQYTLRHNQNMVGEAILPETPMQKQLDQVGSQLVLVSGAVCTLVFGTALLHRYGLDKGILLAIQKLHTPLLDRIMLSITFLGDPAVLLLICLPLVMGSLYSKRRGEATTLGIAAVGAILLNCLLKVVFGRARPALWNWLIDVGQHSFPSGHAMVSMVIYGFIGYILAQEFRQWRGHIFALTVVLIVAIGFSRLYLGVHWPTDVAAGYAAGLVWLIACILRLEWQKYRSSTSSMGVASHT